MTVRRPTGGEFLDIPTAAGLLGVGVDKLRRMVKEGRVPVIVLGPRTRRIPKTALLGLAKGGRRDD